MGDLTGDIAQATHRAQALKAAGRLDEAIQAYAEIVSAFPNSAVALHNLASALGTAGRWAEAEPKIRQALGMGLQAAETALLLARCLQALGDLDGADAAYRSALARRPGDVTAHRELVQMRWMRGGDIASALADLDASLRNAPSTPLVIVKAQALAEAGQHEAAFALLRTLAQAEPENGEIAAIAAQRAIACGDNVGALAYAEKAIQRAPNMTAAHSALCEALLSAGLLERASAAAGEYCRRSPHNQEAIALQATAWRALGDPRYRKLYDYDAFVYTDELDRPGAWPSLSAYLSDLREALDQAHHFQTHPFAQSIRRGSQASDIMALQHPATRALPSALDGPITRYLARLGTGGDLFRARNTGRYAFQGVWSIRMRAGGLHINHIHPQGWISSACYVETPPASGDKEGWLKFGEPHVKMQPALEAERYVEPLPGRLVLFPSFMWHGTVPFSGHGVRLTFAFDLVPG